MSVFVGELGEWVSGIFAKDGLSVGGFNLQGREDRCDGPYIVSTLEASLYESAVANNRRLCLTEICFADPALPLLPMTVMTCRDLSICSLRPFFLLAAPQAMHRQPVIATSVQDVDEGPSSELTP